MKQRIADLDAHARRRRNGSTLAVINTGNDAQATAGAGDIARANGNDATPRGLLAIVATATLFGIAPTTAYADPLPDPHTPNMQAGYCPGGGMGSQISLAYCDGVPYPDGSYWHTIQYGAPMIGHPYGLLSPGMQCVVNPDGGPLPQPAPPGGCGGAV